MCRCHRRLGREGLSVRGTGTQSPVPGVRGFPSTPTALDEKALKRTAQTLRPPEVGSLWSISERRTAFPPAGLGPALSTRSHAALAAVSSSACHTLSELGRQEPHTTPRALALPGMTWEGVSGFLALRPLRAGERIPSSACWGNAVSITPACKHWQHRAVCTVSSVRRISCST